MKKRSFYFLIIISIIILFILNLILKDNYKSLEYLEKDAKDLKEYNLKDITNAFEYFQLFLKPQIIDLNDDCFNLNGLKPNVYELIDDTILIYYFNNKESLSKGLGDIDKVFNNKFYQYQIQDNILIILYPNDYLYSKDADKRIQKVIEYIEENNN